MTDTYIRDTQLAKRYGVARSTIWRWVHDGNFPKPVRLSDQCTRWRSSEVDEWEVHRKPAVPTT